ncbi:hypothetical protein Dimus_023535 [Dionaea muscipula]
MRFLKGGKVEVFSQKEVPSGSWRCAEIVKGNGHYYTVKYYSSTDSCGAQVFDRVPRKAIRPCPPAAELPDIWVSGDVVEVFLYFAWKMATVVRVLSTSQYLVRLHGSSREFRVGEHDLRARLLWQDDGWVSIGKGSNYVDLKLKEHSSRKHNQFAGLLNTMASQHLKDEFVVMGNIESIQESQAAVVSRSRKKRSPICHSEIESYAMPCKKTRVNEKDRRHLRFVYAQCAPPLPEKVYGIASSRKRQVENYIYPSLDHGIAGFSEMISEKGKKDGAISSCSHAVSLESRDTDSVASSVGSCNVLRNYSYEQSNAFPRAPFEESGDTSDAESCCASRPEEENCFLPTGEMLADEIHRLELQAYHRTIKVLHDSGPLSWEKESLLTNLRSSLHISDDEHLMELRSLISCTTRIPAR